MLARALVGSAIVKPYTKILAPLDRATLKFRSGTKAPWHEGTWGAARSPAPLLTPHSVKASPFWALRPHPSLCGSLRPRPGMHLNTLARRWAPAPPSCLCPSSHLGRLFSLGLGSRSLSSNPSKPEYVCTVHISKVTKGFVEKCPLPSYYPGPRSDAQRDPSPRSTKNTETAAHCTYSFALLIVSKICLAHCSGSTRRVLQLHLLGLSVPLFILTILY